MQRKMPGSGYHSISDGPSNAYENPSTEPEVEPEIVAARKRAAMMQRGGIRPEFIILGIVFIVLPLFGYIFYRNILYQIDQFLGAFNSHPCTFSSKDIISGETSEWDLTALSRTPDQCPSGTKCRDYSVAREDEVFFMNVCRHTMQKPRPCRDLLGENSVPSAMGYQTADGVCYLMGRLAGAKWGLLDKKRPDMGLKLTYTGGSQCDGDTDRSTEFRFECDPDAGVGRPLEVFGDCEFVVRWRTAAACPMRQSTLLLFLFWGPLFFGCYLIAGFAYNVLVLKLIPDWEAVPHIEGLRTAGNYLMVFGGMAWERAVAVAPALQDAWEWVMARMPTWARGGGRGADTFFPVRSSSSRSW